MQRRGFLRLMGGGVLLSAIGGAAGYTLTRLPETALSPWSATGGTGDARLDALSWAILAPNPHNRQPWILALEGRDTALLYFDTNRQLPHTDPFDRQLTIGLGCFLELAEMAANADGYAVTTELFPEGAAPDGLDARPIARLRFSASDSVIADPLWPHVPHRRSNKEPYDMARPIPAQALASVLAAARHGSRVGGSIDTGHIADMRILTEAALRIEIETPHTFQESVDLFRIGHAEVDTNPDGIDFTGPVFEGLARAGLFTRESAGDPSSMAYNQGLQAVLENCRTAMGHIWQVTATNTRADQIAAGRDWLRLNLATTAAGLGTQPLSQALQEYPEMAAQYADIHSRLAPEGGTVQMLARIGYGPDIGPSPRWPLDAKLQTT